MPMPRGTWQRTVAPPVFHELCFACNPPLSAYRPRPRAEKASLWEILSQASARRRNTTQGLSCTSERTSERTAECASGCAWPRPLATLHTDGPGGYPSLISSLALPGRLGAPHLARLRLPPDYNFIALWHVIVRTPDQTEDSALESRLHEEPLSTRAGSRRRRSDAARCFNASASRVSSGKSSACVASNKARASWKS